MEFALICMIAAGLSGGFINGLAGFGTGLFALGWLLQVLPPHEAVAIVVACSVLVSLPGVCLLYTSPSPRDATLSRMPSSA